MTADEIRNTNFEHDDGAWESAQWLREIAAQLAELNNRLESGSIWKIAAQLAEIKELLNGKAVERIVSALEGIERK